MEIVRHASRSTRCPKAIEGNDSLQADTLACAYFAYNCLTRLWDAWRLRRTCLKQDDKADLKLQGFKMLLALQACNPSTAGRQAGVSVSVMHLSSQIWRTAASALSLRLMHQCSASLPSRCRLYGIQPPKDPKQMALPQSLLRPLPSPSILPDQSVPQRAVFLSAQGEVALCMTTFQHLS